MQFTQENLEQAKASYKMYEKTRKETVKRLKAKLNPDGTRMYSDEKIQKELATIDAAMNDVVDKYVMMGGKREDIVETKAVKSSKKNSSKSNDAFLDLMRQAEGLQKKEDNDFTATINATKEAVDREIPSTGDYNPKACFDVIPLPSKGEAYPNKKASLPVAFLTAYDEDMIVSPNLYRDNLVLDYIIRAKVMNNEIDPSDLLEGDRDAIVLFLRASGYGNEYPITATDDKTGVQFDAMVDLSKLKYKEFNLKGDPNGWFEFTLPVSKSVVKFRFPTHRDTVTLKKLEEIEEFRQRKEKIDEMVASIETYLEKENKIEANQKAKVRAAIAELRKWEEEIPEEDSIDNSHPITNRFNLLIMSVDGITDKSYILNFVKNMNVRDSTALRKYMTVNEPGIDYNLEINRPESLGGGSMKVFLQLDQFIFLNIPD